MYVNMYMYVYYAYRENTQKKFYQFYANKWKQQFYKLQNYYRLSLQQQHER